jgi:hypothetical protein
MQDNVRTKIEDALALLNEAFAELKQGDVLADEHDCLSDGIDNIEVLLSLTKRPLTVMFRLDDPNTPAKDVAEMVKQHLLSEGICKGTGRYEGTNAVDVLVDAASLKLLEQLPVPEGIMDEPEYISAPLEHLAELIEWRHTFKCFCRLQI